MMNIKPKIKDEYIYLASMVVLGALILFLFFKMSLPGLKLYRVQAKEVGEKEKELGIRKATVQQVNKLKQEINKIDEEYKSFTQKIILEPQTFEAVKVITDIAKGKQIEFLLIQPLPLRKLELPGRKDEEASKLMQKQVKGFFLWEIPILVKIKSNYANLLDFIKKIEDDKRFLKIKNIHIVKDPSTPLIHGTEITISMFSLPETQALKNE